MIRLSIAEGTQALYFESKSEFLEDLKTIQINDVGYGCPMKTLDKLNDALTSALPHSYIYVFTDATYNDYVEQEAIIQFVTELQISVRNS